MKTFVPRLLTFALLFAFTFVLASLPNRIGVEAREDATLLTTQLNGVTTGTATPFMVSGCRENAVYIIWSAGASAGGVTVETADAVDYAGTWAPLIVVPWSAASKQDIVQVTGVQMYLRTRISTTVSGGTVITRVVCN